MAGKKIPTREDYIEYMDAYHDKQHKKNLYLKLLECYNTMPIYITDPAVFSRQCATAMSQASGAEEFVDMMADLKEKNMAEAVTHVQKRLTRSSGLSCLVSMDSMLHLAGVPVYEGVVETDSPTLDELNPDWDVLIWAFLPERSEYLGGLPPDYLSTEEESGSEEDDDSQSDYSESSRDEEEPVKSNKSQKRGASRSTSSSSPSSTSTSTGGRTLRNGKRTRTSDGADTVVDEAHKNKRRRKGKATSNNSSCRGSSRCSSNNRSSSSSRSASPPKPASAPASIDGGTILEDEDLPLLRRSGRLNRVTGRRSNF